MKSQFWRFHIRYFPFYWKLNRTIWIINLFLFETHAKMPVQKRIRILLRAQPSCPVAITMYEWYLNWGQPKSHRWNRHRPFLIWLSIIEFQNVVAQLCFKCWIMSKKRIILRFSIKLNPTYQWDIKTQDFIIYKKILA